MLGTLHTTSFGRFEHARQFGEMGQAVSYVCHASCLSPQTARTYHTSVAGEFQTV